jgi:hypothetical protein
MKNLILTICLFLISGCSTIMNGPTQKIKVTSNPSGAWVTTTDFRCWVKTPGEIELERSHSTILTASLYGYEDCKKKIKCSLSPFIAGNAVGQLYPWSFLGIADGGIVLTLFDLSTGSVGNLTPTKVHFELVPIKRKQFKFGKKDK